MRALVLNGTKNTLRDAFIENLLHCKVRTDEAMMKESSFETTIGFLTCLLTIRQPMSHICGFPRLFQV